MNQILDYKLDKSDFSFCSNNSQTSKFNKKKKKRNEKSSHIYATILIISIFFLLALSIYCCFYFYNLHHTDINAKQLSQSFLVSTLYSNSNNYSATSLNSTYVTNNTTPIIIGTIHISKINLHYPILSYANEATLQKSLARFAGPMPNQIGNLCIAGHNNIDNSFFGKLNLLDIGDEIIIYDLSGNYLTYNVYNKYETVNTDLSCTSQNTNGFKIVTLITCNSLKGTRKIYVAKAE